MTFRFTIGKRIGIGFGILILFVILVFSHTYRKLSESIAISDNILYADSILSPLSELEKLKTEIIESKMYIYNWVYNQESSHPDKGKLKRLIKYKYPPRKKHILESISKWDEEDKTEINVILNQLDTLYDLQKEIMGMLSDFSSYQNPKNIFLCNSYIAVDGDIYTKTEAIISKLNYIIFIQKYKLDKETKKMQNSFSFLKSLVIYLGLALILGGLLIAIYTTRSIIKPINKLKSILLVLSKGVFPKKTIKARNDEIGEMTNALNRVVTGLKSTKDFAEAVGSGQFNTKYESLSEKDSLGKALLKMREDLATTERELEEKVRKRTAEVVQQKEEIELQNTKISELYEEVTDSIKYAKGLQEAILPPSEFIEKVFPDSFVLYQPKDIVSGDFYWVQEKNNIVYFAAVDCTGHGVPGAFMSIVGYNQLKEAFRENDMPSAILDDLNKGISETLNNNHDLNSITKDGMDLALCSYNPNTRELQYSGAYNPLYIVRNGKVDQITADKFAIGSYYEDQSKKYTNHAIQLERDDCIYIFSDGYADQFGGPNGKKFMYQRFRDLLIDINHNEMTNQKEALNNVMKEWKGGLKQIDDILVIGMRVV